MSGGRPATCEPRDQDDARPAGADQYGRLVNAPVTRAHAADRAHGNPRMSRGGPLLPVVVQKLAGEPWRRFDMSTAEFIYRLLTNPNRAS